MLVQTDIIRPRVPASLVALCDKPWRKPGAAPSERAGGARKVDDLYTRGDVNEARLVACAAKVAGIGEWDRQ
ncbi:hypothetical protein LB543_01490 [Mesorhizobium sp. ESP7-2]|uniref:hypothetical protein n=1 Tax=Mesorhizobium sp. ESP7-2 TaxID=2876622 RepID=UPI001CCF6E93|nr:hypothetical protein [Mesorhizobium sp. ESP7-2]MBZ9705402.1 hypothetical protein [Mesorhizobium sp. ESP7-2]